MNIQRIRKQTGFTLLELAIVMVIVGILAAIAVANFTDLTSTAQSSAADYSSNMVKTAWSSYYASNSAAPTVAQLAASVNQNGTAASVASSSDGIVITINSTSYKVATYSTANCGTATSTSALTVLCVGSAAAGS